MRTVMRTVTHTDRYSDESTVQSFISTHDVYPSPEAGGAVMSTVMSTVI
jgi:hypothetical protein